MGRLYTRREYAAAWPDSASMFDQREEFILTIMEMALVKWGPEKSKPIIRAWIKAGQPPVHMDTFAPPEPGTIAKDARAFV